MSQQQTFFSGADTGIVNSVTGTNGVTATPTTGAVTVSGVNATTSTVGVASFNPADFSVNSAGQVSTLASTLPVTVPTSFLTTNNTSVVGTPGGTATLTANVLTLNAASVSTNDVSGIQAAAIGSTVVYELTNRIQGSGTTVDGSTPVQLYSFPLGTTPGVYQFTTTLVAYNTTDSIGAGYTSYRTVRTTGAEGVLIDAFISSIGEEGAMTGISVVNSISGNNVVLSATGLTDKIIDYYALTTYIFVS